VATQDAEVAFVRTQEIQRSVPMRQDDHRRVRKADPEVCVAFHDPLRIPHVAEEKVSSWYAPRATSSASAS
jgi:hypothetical protein